MSRSNQEFTPHRVGIWPWLALLMGVLVGSMIGFSLRPTTVTGSPPWEMSRNYKQQYLGLLSEVYAADGNGERVRSQLRGWRPEDVAALLAEMEAGSNDPAEITRLAAMREIARIPAAEPTFMQLLRDQPLIMFSLGATGIVLLIAGAVGLLVSTEQERLSRILAQAIQERAKAYPQHSPSSAPPDLRALSDAINKTNNEQLGKLLQAAEKAQAAAVEKEAAQPAHKQQRHEIEPPKDEALPKPKRPEAAPAVSEAAPEPQRKEPPAPRPIQPPEPPGVEQYNPPPPEPKPQGLFATLQNDPGPAHPPEDNRQQEPPQFEPTALPDGGQFVQPESELARMMRLEMEQAAATAPIVEPPQSEARPVQQAPEQMGIKRTNQPPSVIPQNVEQTRRPLPQIEQPQTEARRPPPAVQPPPPPQPAYQPPQPPAYQPPIEVAPPIQQTTPLPPPPRRAPPPPPPEPTKSTKQAFSDDPDDSKAKIGEILADVFVDEGLLQKQALLHGLVPVDVHQLLNQAAYTRQQLKSGPTAP